VRRADRLFQIIQLLRRQRVVTAARLAQELEVSERTIYRDLRDLMQSGTPIEGEPGVGYTLRKGYDLPPLMFDEEEIEALVLGARLVASFGDERLARASRTVLSKVESVLPKARRAKLKSIALFAPNPHIGRRISAKLASARHAIGQRLKLSIQYERLDGESSHRVVRPLGAFFWGQVWTLATWCELREGFRNFRIDRIGELELLDQSFEDEDGKTLRDYLIEIDEDALRAIDNK
jgi:predicted DNA-binding transcriptional regulator YafY